MTEFCYKCQSPVSLCICDESITDETEYHAWCEKRIAELERQNAEYLQAYEKTMKANAELNAAATDVVTWHHKLWLADDFDERLEANNNLRSSLLLVEKLILNQNDERKAKETDIHTLKILLDRLSRRLVETKSAHKHRWREAMKLKNENQRLREAATELRNALQDRWAANDDAELYKANARVEAADATLAALLREGEE